MRVGELERLDWPRRRVFMLPPCERKLGLMTCSNATQRQPSSPYTLEYDCVSSCSYLCNAVDCFIGASVGVALEALARTVARVAVDAAVARLEALLVHASVGGDVIQALKDTRDWRLIICSL